MQRAVLELEHDALAFGIVLGENRAMAPLLDRKGASLAFRPMARIENHSVFIGRSRKSRPEKDLEVRRARRTDAGELAALWNRVQASRDLSPVWDGPGLARRLNALGVGFESLWIAERRGKPVAFAAAWDASGIKQLRLLSLSRGLAWLRPAFNAAARAVGRAAIPRDGDLVSFVYVTHFCAETADDLRALLRRIHDEFIGSPYLYFDLALDVRDPLAAALAGFSKTSVAFDLHWIARRDSDMPDATAAPTYFDMALV